MTMTPNLELVPVFAIAALYFARVREFFIKRALVRGPVRERLSFACMFLAGTLVSVFCVVEYFMLERGFNPWTFYPGLAVAFSSFVIRNWAIQTLGKFWSVHVEIRDEHVLVTEGPFRYMRHPVYFAAALELIGPLIFLNAWWSSLAILLLFVPAVTYRIRLEEQALFEKFGDQYRKYVQMTPAVIPLRLGRN